MRGPHALTSTHLVGGLDLRADGADVLVVRLVEAVRVLRHLGAAARDRERRAPLAGGHLRAALQRRLLRDGTRRAHTVTMWA